MGLAETIKEKYNVTGKPPFYLPISRWDGLPELYTTFGYKLGAEIGVARGEYSECLFKKIPNLTLYCIDSWLHYSGYRDTVSQTRFDSMYLETVNRLKNYDAHIMRAFSEDAVKHIPDNSLDFIFIDAAHDFFHVTQDIYLWERKVKNGGIVSGHDFKRDKGRDWQCHVKDVILAWAYSHGINNWFVCKKDKSPSWFWVKE